MAIGPMRPRNPPDIKYTGTFFCCSNPISSLEDKLLSFNTGLNKIKKLCCYLINSILLYARREMKRMVLDEISNLLQRRFDDLESSRKRFSEVHFTGHRTVRPKTTNIYIKQILLWAAPFSYKNEISFFSKKKKSFFLQNKI